MIYTYNVLKDYKFKAGPFNNKKEYSVEKGKQLVINIRLEQLENDGILQLIPEVKK